MAGRSLSPRERALAALGAALIGGVIALAAVALLDRPSPAPLVVAQTDTNASIAFGWRDDTGGTQEIAQTFVPPQEADALMTLSVLLGADDRNAVVKVYEVGEEPPLGALLRSFTVPVDYRWGDPGSGWIHTRIDPPLPVQPGQRYSFVLSSEQPGDSLSAAGGADRYATGEAWCFCPELGRGAPAYGAQRWQDMGADGAPTDVSFELRFRPAA